MTTSATCPSPDRRTVTAIWSAERNDEEGLPVLDRRPAGDEDLADLAVGGSADLRDLTQRLDPAKRVAARDRVARAPLARRREDPDGGRVDTLGLLPRRLPIVVTGRPARRRAVGVVAGDGDREAACHDSDGIAAESVGRGKREWISGHDEQMRD